MTMEKLTSTRSAHYSRISTVPYVLRISNPKFIEIGAASLLIQP